MKALKILGIIIGVLILLGVIGSYIPSSFDVTRSATIDAPKDQIMSQVVDLNDFAEWNPWSEGDTTMSIEVMGEPATIGHKYTWSSETQGDGEMEITDIDGSEVTFQLIFSMDPDNVSHTTFSFEEVEGGTLVSWHMEGETALIWSYLMDVTLGTSFEKGLANLKNRVDAMEVEPVFEIVEIDLPETHYLIHREEISMSDMESFFTTHFGALFGGLTAAGIEPASMPSALYWTWDMENEKSDLAAAVAVASPDVTLEGYELFTVPASKALQIHYYGPYEGVGDAHMALDAYILENNLDYGSPVMEEYANDPAEVAPEEILTIVTYPIAHKMDSSEEM
ncbi:SRPBCC family protein [Phaeocystidibacter marisrubri]|uniref:AraC effector-binding domain-containing protein n=1 Tax=Phaeocystidibacter marisrubri TaxID=1577780 RepID=A0A6L3ZJH3_9FLAO|nr:GyrI-like domain-containing protein [Phaeocystidibacter marisrubri]KAB2817803.1 hypothetical protein F8C82_05205 [Phaeocystidibacter marisrubri]GGH73454.1 hypothetical protein GCM10011318_18490 [Phaeocystidibacter marisrubri]